MHIWALHARIGRRRRVSITAQINDYFRYLSRFSFCGDPKLFFSRVVVMSNLVKDWFANMCIFLYVKILYSSISPGQTSFRLDEGPRAAPPQYQEPSCPGWIVESSIDLKFRNRSIALFRESIKRNCLKQFIYPRLPRFRIIWAIYTGHVSIITHRKESPHPK